MPAVLPEPAFVIQAEAPINGVSFSPQANSGLGFQTNQTKYLLNNKLKTTLQELQRGLRMKASFKEYFCLGLTMSVTESNSSP
jgi:hypothetical protein